MREDVFQVPGPYTDIPLLAVVPETRRGTVLFFHGLHEKKERYHDVMRALAGRGFLAVGVDAIAHGERRARDFEQQVAHGFPVIVRWAEETARETPAILAGLEQRLGALGPLGICGVSFGGYIAYMLGTREPRVAAVTAILGSPELPVGDSPHRRPHDFAPRPLLAINCEYDQSVPPEPARRFVQALRPRYADAGAVEYVEYPKWGHLLSEQHFADTWARTLVFFERWLR